MRQVDPFLSYCTSALDDAVSVWYRDHGVLAEGPVELEKTSRQYSRIRLEVDIWFGNEPVWEVDAGCDEWELIGEPHPRDSRSTDYGDHRGVRVGARTSHQHRQVLSISGERIKRGGLVLPFVEPGIWPPPARALPSPYRDDPSAPTFSSLERHGTVHEYAPARILVPWRSQWTQSGATNYANSEAHAVFCDVQVWAFGQGSYRQKSLVLTHSWPILARFNAECRSKKRTKRTSKPTTNCWPPTVWGKEARNNGSRESTRDAVPYAGSHPVFSYNIHILGRIPVNSNSSTGARTGAWAAFNPLGFYGY